MRDSNWAMCLANWVWTGIGRFGQSRGTLAGIGGTPLERNARGWTRCGWSSIANHLRRGRGELRSQMPRQWDEGSHRNLRQAKLFQGMIFPRHGVEIGRRFAHRPAPPVRQAENEIIPASLRPQRQKRKRSAMQRMAGVNDRNCRYEPSGNGGIVT